MWTIEDNFFVRNRLHPNLAGRTFPHADPFFGNQYQIAVSDLASQLLGESRPNLRIKAIENRVEPSVEPR